jgi:hypothetical protein
MSRNVAVWNGSSWTALGNGIGDPFSQANAVTAVASGEIFVGGNFLFAGNNLSAYFARWGPPPGCSTLACDSLDFNNDGSTFDPMDVDALLSVFSEGPCIPSVANCNDVDFNNDGSLFDPCDIDSFLLVFSEGPCTLCGA